MLVFIHSGLDLVVAVEFNTLVIDISELVVANAVSQNWATAHFT